MFKIRTNEVIPQEEMGRMMCFFLLWCCYYVWNIKLFINSFIPSLLFPSYYVNGRDTSLEDFLDPEILDTLAVKTNEVLEVTARSLIQQRLCV